MKLYVLNCGQIYLERAFLWHFGTKEDSGREYVPETFCSQPNQYYIDHPDAKILFDTGWTLEDLAKMVGVDPSKVQAFPLRRGPEGLSIKQEPDENPVAQLEKIGVKIDDIDYVVVSHLMVDHAGWLPVFAGKKAQVVLQRQEYEYARRIGTPNISGEDPPVEQFHSWMYFRPNYEVPGLTFKLIEGDHELVKDVLILSAPGHTPGYQVMLVRLPKTGTVVLSPCEHRGMYYALPINSVNDRAPGIPHAFTWFAAEELRTFKRIREFVDREKGQIFCGHDCEHFKTLRHVPEYYE